MSYILPRPFPNLFLFYFLISPFPFGVGTLFFLHPPTFSRLHAIDIDVERENLQLYFFPCTISLANTREVCTYGSSSRWFFIVVCPFVYRVSNHWTRLFLCLQLAFCLYIDSVSVLYGTGGLLAHRFSPSCVGYAGQGLYVLNFLLRLGVCLCVYISIHRSISLSDCLVIRAKSSHRIVLLLPSFFISR